MFRVLAHPSSGVLKTVTAASSTGDNTGTATSLQHGLIGALLHLAGFLFILNYDAWNYELKSSVIGSYLCEQLGPSCIAALPAEQYDRHSASVFPRFAALTVQHKPQSTIIIQYRFVNTACKTTHNNIQRSHLHTHTHTITYIQAYIHIYILTNIHIYIDIYIHTYILYVHTLHTCVCYISIYTHTHIHCIYVRMSVHTYIHTYIYYICAHITHV